MEREIRKTSSGVGGGGGVDNPMTTDLDTGGFAIGSTASDSAIPLEFITGTPLANTRSWSDIGSQGYFELRDNGYASPEFLRIGTTSSAGLPSAVLVANRELVLAAGTPGDISFQISESSKLLIRSSEIFVYEPLKAQASDVDLGAPSSEFRNQYMAGFIDINGSAAPPLSGTGTCREYFDSTTNKKRISENGGAYVDVV